MFTEILNSFLNVRNKVKNADGDWVDQTKPRETQHMISRLNQTVEGSGEITSIFRSFGKRVILESFEYGADGNNVYPLLWTEDGDINNYNYNLFHVIQSRSARAYGTPYNLESFGSEFLNVVERSADGAKINLKRPIVLPNGGELAFRTQGSDAGNVTYKVLWREIEND